MSSKTNVRYGFRLSPIQKNNNSKSPHRTRKSTHSPIHEITITDINHKKHYGHWDGTTSNDSISFIDKGDFPLKDIKEIVFKSNITEMQNVTGGKRRKSRNNRKSARKTQRRP